MQSQTFAFQYPKSLINQFLNSIQGLEVVSIGIFTAGGGKRGAYSCHVRQLTDLVFMREQFEELEKFRNEWPLGHIEVVVSKTTITLTLT
jgi:hypothetical protein